MSFADWIILIVVVGFSRRGDQIRFFSGGLRHLAGLVVGYLLAAWQYHRLAESLASLSEVVAGWLRLQRSWSIFVGVLIVAGIAGRIARWAMKEVRIEHSGSHLRGCDWHVERRTGGSRGADGYDGLHAHVKVVGEFTVGAVFLGAGPGRNLGSTRGIARTVLPGTGFVASAARTRPDGHWKHRPGQVEAQSARLTTFKQLFTRKKKERRRERSARSPYYADVQKQHSVFRGRA